MYPPLSQLLERANPYQRELLLDLVKALRELRREILHGDDTDEGVR